MFPAFLLGIVDDFLFRERFAAEISIIASYQPHLKVEEFQVWTLMKKEDNSAVVSCTDGNDRILKIQEIPWTDFKVDTATIWVEIGVALLPSEH